MILRTPSPTRTSAISRHEEDLWQWAERRETTVQTLASRTESSPALAYAVVRNARFSNALTWCRKVLKSRKRR